MIRRRSCLLLLCTLVLASCSGENRAWKNAESARSIAAYENYLAQYPQGKFSEDAAVRIEALHYETAEKENTVDAYTDFLGQYGKGQYADKARSQTETLYFNQAKTANSIEAYQAFLKRYPEGESAEQARKMLEVIYPSFSETEVLEIRSASALVGTGEISFVKGSRPGALKITVNVSAPVVAGETCMGCGTLVKIGPDLEVPVRPFFTSMKPPGPTMGNVSRSVSFANMVLEGPTPADATEFIVSGPHGATLRKEGRGFRLVQGEAHFLKKGK